jgi:hypothetical protein
MRFVTIVVVVSMLSLECARAPAASVTDNQAIVNELQAKADQAESRDKCFLYAKLVSRMTELAGQQFNAGDSMQASETLGLVRRYAEKIQAGIADDSKKLKLAELLVRHTSYRLKDILYEASYEDRPALEATLNQMNKVQALLMTQVFRK